MPRLTHRATQKAFEFLRDLCRLRSWDDLTTYIIGSVPTLIPTDICSYNDMSARRRFAVYRAWLANHPTIPDAQEKLGRWKRRARF